MGGDPYVPDVPDVPTAVDETWGQKELPTARGKLQVSDPYGDQALLTPAMTKGYEAVPAEERERLRRYLEAVVAVRRAPVHTTVAFNAVYFGYDLDGDGYGGSPLRLDDFPVITSGERSPALPVGSMVCVATGSDPLYAEIVYREGAHPEIGALGDVPAWVSGAPAGAEGPGKPGDGSTPLRRELLVPDPDAFGPALSLSPAQLHRLRTRRRWINEDGHVLVDVRYSSATAARRDELTAYADHLLTTAREQLLSPYVPVSLATLVGGTRDPDLRTGLLGLLGTVRDVLNSSDAVRLWGDYAMTRTSLADCWKDTGPLGGDDLRSLAAALERAAIPGKRRYGFTTPVTVYTAVGPRLRAFSGATELLRGLGYAAAVCRANVALADIVRGDSEQGLFDNGSRITLDDAFEGGGVWRSRHPGDGETSGDPLVPAGNGWASTLPARSEPELEPGTLPVPVDAPLADDASLSATELLRSSVQEIVWRTPLRLAQLIDGWVPVHPFAVEELRWHHGDPVTVCLELEHVDQASDARSAAQEVVAELGDDAGRLTGITWPDGFFPGLVLELRLRRGEPVIHLATTPLKEPVRIGDRETAHWYDPRVLTREDVPGSDRHGDSAVGLGPQDLVMRTVRRCGLLTLDGHALMDPSVLPSAVYGCRPARSQVDALESAVAELLARRILEPALGSRDAWGQPVFPPRDGQPTIPLIGYRPAQPRLIRLWAGDESTGDEFRGVQFVPGHLRRLRPDHCPSDVQRAAFREHCRRLGKADGWELPYGYTFVTEHTRGR
ncbi:hypothetical protein [Streptomyces sp. CA2R106]|uniref:hypothetical protein n=1 Tax=Streptomyces sp. CA2R106 TaxID=3120153 RepID=UPI003008E209